jgi:hypothetical protein
MRHFVEREGEEQDRERDEDLGEVDVQRCLTLSPALSLEP